MLWHLTVSVALFAVPLLSFHFISTNNPYEMNYRFIPADTLQKIIVLTVLSVWSRVSARGSEWSITLTHLLWVFLYLKGCMVMILEVYMVQIVVLQCIIWYTLMLFRFEYRGARMLIAEQFPDTGGSIVSFRVDSDIISLDEKEPLETQAEIGEDGKLHVTVRKSNASRSDVFSKGFSMTPRPSNLTNVEIYSLQSSRNPTPRGSSFTGNDGFSYANFEAVGYDFKVMDLGQLVERVLSCFGPSKFYVALTSTAGGKDLDSVCNLDVKGYAFGDHCGKEIGDGGTIFLQ